MIIYIPKEIKQGEGRVFATPQHVSDYKRSQAIPYIEAGAGIPSGFRDFQYKDNGAAIIPSTPDRNDLTRMGIPPIIKYEEDGINTLILKVKEVVLPDERWMIQPYHTLISFGHLASNRELVELIIARRGTYLSLEDIVEPSNPPYRPILAGMSKIAGEEAVRIGMKYFSEQKPEMIIVGYGKVGEAAHRVAEKELWIPVTAIDPDYKKLKHYAEMCRQDKDSPAPFGFLTCPQNEIPQLLERLMGTGEYRKPLLIILAPYAPENKAPIIITNEMIKNITDDSIIVDVSIDQGGACEFSRITTHEIPVIELERGIKYIGIPNLPGGVPGRSTSVFSESVFPYMMQIVKLGFIEALKANPALRNAVSIYEGKVTSEGLAKTFGLEHTPIEKLL